MAVRDHAVDHVGLVLLGVLHRVGQLGKRDGRELDVELLEKLALVAHGRPEVEGTGPDLEDSHVAELLHHVADGEEVEEAALELGVVEAAVRHVRERDVESAQDLAGCEEPALGVAQADAVLEGRLVARAPEQHGNVELLCEAGALVLRSEVSVRKEESVDLLGLELSGYLLAVLVVVEETLLVDVRDVDVVDAQLVELGAREVCVLDRVGRAEDAAPRRGYAELYLLVTVSHFKSFLVRQLEATIWGTALLRLEIVFCYLFISDIHTAKNALYKPL